MQYIITEEDKMLVQQRNISARIKINIVSNDKKILGTLTGVANIGGFNIDADSDIRRTSSFEVQLDDSFSHIESKIEAFLNVGFDLYFCVKRMRSDDYIEYKLGTLYVTSNNTTYDAVTNTLSLDLSDGFVKLDGTINGQVGGAPTITIPVEHDGVKNTLRSSMLSVIKSETEFKDYIIDDIGEYYGMPQNNVDYQEYRELNPDWNVLPYDLEFSPGNTVADILTEIRDLYPNCQLYFDIYGILCCDMIPSNNNTPITLTNDYLKSIIVASGSENVSYDMSQIKNVVEIFGKTYDIDRFSEGVSSYNNSTYSIQINLYEAYKSNDIIAFTAGADNTDNSSIKINELDVIPLYYEYTTNYVHAGIIKTDDVSAIKIKKDNTGSYVAYYLGQYQPHALAVLTDNINDATYTKSYFAQKYNCLEKNIVMIESKDSPFSIQRQGILFESKSGDEYDNIISDSVAMENAKYLIYQYSVWHDVVTITTKIMPWLDVHIKVEYQKQQDKEPHIYIVKSISHDFGNCTSSITMYRFSSLYQE